MPVSEGKRYFPGIFVQRTSLFYLFHKLPSWRMVGAWELPGGKGIGYKYEKLVWLQEAFPKIGKWPRQLWWRRFKIGSPRPGDYPMTELRQLPGMVRVGFSKLIYVALYGADR